MRVKDIMTTPVVTVAPDQRLKCVARLLLRLKIGAVPVVDRGSHLIGILSEADLVGLQTSSDPRAHLLLRLSGGPDHLPGTVRELMTTDVVSLPDDADVADAAHLMLKHGHRSIPVVAARRVVGILARRDLLKVLARSDADIRAELEELLEDQAGIIDRYQVDVVDGVTLLTGPADPASRGLPQILARTVPGVVEVRFDEGRAPVAS
jgi:CBS domain-containing protein